MVPDTNKLPAGPWPCQARRAASRTISFAHLSEAPVRARLRSRHLHVTEGTCRARMKARGLEHVRRACARLGRATGAREFERALGGALLQKWDGSETNGVHLLAAWRRVVVRGNVREGTTVAPGWPLLAFIPGQLSPNINDAIPVRNAHRTTQASCDEVQPGN